MTPGAECYAYVGGPCGQSPGAHIHEDWAVVQAVDPATGKEVPDGEWGNLTVTTLDRDNGLLRYDLEEACAILREPVPVRGDLHPRTVGRALQGPARAARALASSSTSSRRSCEASKSSASPRSSTRWSDPTGATGHWWCGWRWRRRTQRCERRRASRRPPDCARRSACVADVEILPRDTIPRAGYKATRVIEPGE